MLLKSQTNSYYKKKSKSIQKYQVIFTKKERKKQNITKNFKRKKIETTTQNITKKETEN